MITLPVSDSHHIAQLLMLLEIFGGRGKQWSDRFLMLALPLHDTHSVAAASTQNALTSIISVAASIPGNVFTSSSITLLDHAYQVPIRCLTGSYNQEMVGVYIQLHLCTIRMSLSPRFYIECKSFPIDYQFLQ